MSVHMIYYENGAKKMRPVLTAAEYRNIRNSEKQRKIVALVRQGDEKLKHRLVQMNYSCLPNDDGTLKGSKRMSGTVGMDVDWPKSTCTPAGRIEEAVERIMSRREELGLLMLERSATKGLHVVFRRRGELSQEENLRWASELLGVEYDKAAKDITRVFFTTTASEEDLLFLSEEVFFNGEKDAPSCSHKGKERAREGDGEDLQLTLQARELTDEKGEDLQLTLQARELTDEKGKELQQTLQAREHAGLDKNDGGAGLPYPYADIVRKYWEMFYEGKEPVEGDRNVKTYELAMTLRPICDYNMEKLMAVVPRYDGFPEDEYRRTLENALKEPRKGMPYRLRQVLAALKNDRRMALLSGREQSGNGEGLMGAMPERPKRMPEVLKLLSSKVPMKYKAMVEEAVWPAMCAHLKGVTFRYIDGVVHEANISSPLIGRQSSGKGAVNMPIEHLLADITTKDKENEARLLDWRRRNQGKGASKDRQPRPEDIVIQRLDDDLTPAALSQALIDAENNGGKRVITKVDEIELLNRVGNGKNDTVGVLVRYGWDNARWGQRRVGLDSVNGSYTVRWVWNASCTLKSARKFITNTWIADGSLSRLNVNALLLAKDDNEMPKIGEYDEKYASDLKVYVDRLNAANGLIECPQANRLAEELKREHDRIADLCESEGYRTFSYRAVVIGWLKAMMLFVMNGYRWDKATADYVRYSVRRDMYLKMYFFGRQIEEEFDEEERQQHCGPQNLLVQLPTEFSYEDFLQLRKSQGRQGDGKSTLRVWKTRGYVEYDEVTERWVKLLS